MSDYFDSDELLLSDVLLFMPPLPDDLDEETSSTLLTFRKNIYQRRVQKVNEYYAEFKEIWPKGTPIELFLALEKSNDDINQAIQNISTPLFLREITNEIEMHSNHKSTRSKKRSSEINFFFDDEDEDAEWSSREIENLKQLVNKYGTRFKEISKHIRGRSSQSCKNMYLMLKSEKVTYKPRKKRSKNVKLDKLDSITFIKDQKRYIVGTNTLKYHELESVNPLPGYLDQLTLKPMRLATLSPDGYVLDYDTWIKLLKEQKVNPFTQNKIKSQRELIILTQENFNEYKDMIVNLDNIKPID